MKHAQEQSVKSFFTLNKRTALKKKKIMSCGRNIKTAHYIMKQWCKELIRLKSLFLTDWYLNKHTFISQEIWKAGVWIFNFLCTNFDQSLK